MKPQRIKRVRIPVSGRTEELERAYQIDKLEGNVRPLSDEPALISYEHWYLIANRYPYNILYQVHDMLVTRRKIAGRTELTVKELIELNEIIDELANQYNAVFENMPNRRSVKDHYHVHLVRYYPSRQDIKL